ncbi:MAG: hypothetical protein NT145_01105 [Elusimicrobia bacterium]|nr:hypothetical protein [Elusimicrobiota bacterium]
MKKVNENIEVLKTGLNRSLTEGKGIWKAEYIEKLDLNFDDILPILKEWEKKGHIKINLKLKQIQVINLIE